MIYNFPLSDDKTPAFLAILERSGIDYEVTQHDHIVVRILGRLTPEIESQIRNAGITSSSMTLHRKAESACYEAITNRSELAIVAGPCAVESAEQLSSIAKLLNQLGVRFLRGGAYKPRTRVDSFQGLGLAGLKLLRECSDRYGLFVVTEIMDRSQIDSVAQYADILQVGSRNMHNYTLLAALGSVDRPVLIKRGMSSTLSEWLAAAEYVSRGGNDRIILCERGIRTFEPEIAHTIDLAAIVLAKTRVPYPVIADTSHASGRSDLVAPLALGAVAAGADGIMIEVHPTPAQALSDGKQALDLSQFENLVANARRIFATRQHFSHQESKSTTHD